VSKNSLSGGERPGIGLGKLVAGAGVSGSMPLVGSLVP
jgi:hypothetical protein